MTEFTSFVERPEKVEAFKFVGPHQVEQVLDAFEVSHDKWTLQKEGKNKYRLSFPLKRTKPHTPQVVGGQAIYQGTINIGQIPTLFYEDPSGTYAVTSGSWVVRRYIDTDHPEVGVLSDKEFRRKYRAQIEAASA